MNRKERMIDREQMDKAKKNVSERFNIEESQAEDYLKQHGPKRLMKMGLLEDKFSWRAGFTKPTIESRKAKNRKKNKLARKARRANR